MPVFYFDSSAIVKLIVDEAETDALAALSDEGGLWMTSDLARVEVQRAIARRQPQALDAARRQLRGLALMTLTGDTYDLAGRLQPAFLRSLDAIHVAAALSLGAGLTALVTYDQRLAVAAATNGLTVLSPGASIPG